MVHGPAPIGIGHEAKVRELGQNKDAAYQINRARAELVPRRHWGIYAKKSLICIDQLDQTRSHIRVIVGRFNEKVLGKRLNTTF